MSASGERQLAQFIAKFTPQMARLIRAARRKMRARLPHAVEMVYDNYNFFVIGYGPNVRTSDAIFSLAAYARGLRLFFLQGRGLPDPEGLLEGSGKKVRSVRIESAAALDSPRLRALVGAALARAKVPLDPRSPRALVIKSVSAKQRARRAPEATADSASPRKRSPARKPHTV
jgi:hypothetical protein